MVEDNEIFIAKLNNVPEYMNLGSNEIVTVQWINTNVAMVAENFIPTEMDFALTQLLNLLIQYNDTGKVMDVIMKDTSTSIYQKQIQYSFIVGIAFAMSKINIQPGTQPGTQPRNSGWEPHSKKPKTKKYDL